MNEKETEPKKYNILSLDVELNFLIMFSYSFDDWWIPVIVKESARGPTVLKPSSTVIIKSTKEAPTNERSSVAIIVPSNKEKNILKAIEEGKLIK